MAAFPDNLQGDIQLISRLEGGAENAGLENAGVAKMQGWKTRDWKMQESEKYGKRSFQKCVSDCTD